jgi:nucleotide-binding universal stress UspA family protein
MEPQDRAGRRPVVAAYSAAIDAREPVEFAVAASRLTGAPLTVVAVHQGGPTLNRFIGEVDDTVGEARPALESLRQDLQQRGVDVQIVVVNEDTVARGLERALLELKPGLVAVGSSARRGVLRRVLRGETAEHVIHAARCPVAVVPHGYQPPEAGLRTIGAAFARTLEGNEALHAAAVLARAGGARVRAIMVVDPHIEEQSPGLMAKEHHDLDARETATAREEMGAEAQLREAIAAVAGDLEVDVDVLANDPADGLVAASEFVDLLVMGSRARAPRRALILGSVSRKVTERAHCPVVVLPRGAAEATELLLSSLHAPSA